MTNPIAFGLDALAEQKGPAMPTTPDDELSPLQRQTPPTRPILYAKIKRSSKYAYQGEREGQAVLLRVTELDDDHYAFYLENGNRYRREDLAFFTKSPKGQLLKLS